MPKIASIYSIYRSGTGISTDTRTIQEGNLYFALKGEHFDGNNYIEYALQQGAAYCISSDPQYLSAENVLVVKDTLQTLQELANYHRHQLTIPFIAITGSNGKTTTKELLANCLGTKFKTHFTRGNLNNHIGVPLTILQITKETEIAIIEMGANHIGEIAALCQIAEPTYGLITNIGDAHLDGFGSPEGVLKGKSELADYIRQHQGIFFINANEKSLAPLQEKFSSSIHYGDHSNCVKTNYNIAQISSDPVLQFSLNDKIYISQLAGGYNYNNILTAIAVSDYFGVTPVDSAKAISAYSPNNNRSQWREYMGTRILMDAYNANPSSMQQAILNFSHLQVSPKSLILGDMKELGKYSTELHKKILDLISTQNGITQVILIGPEFYSLKSIYPKFNFYPATTDLQINWDSLSGHSILLKGSRGIRLEALLHETD